MLLEFTRYCHSLHSVLALHTYKVYWVYDLENATTQANVGMAQLICIT